MTPRYYPPGTRIAGRYEIASRPLMGGMGIVYFCYDHGEDRPVALKTFQPRFLPDRATRDLFLREGSHWVALGRHPHIVHCYQVVHVDPEVYLVLELVAKETGREDASLRSWLGRPLPAAQALLLALQIARGMKHATAAIPGLVHLDLKPENLLVGSDRLSQADVNRLRITDFGLAQVLRAAPSSPAGRGAGGEDAAGARHSMRAPGFAGGTPEYAAPEQWGQQRLDLRADVYALGCILVEMLTGRMPVRARPRLACGRLHRAGRALEAARGLPPALRSLLAGCLAVDPQARYGDWGAVEAALAEAYAATTGRPAPGPEPVRALGRAERVAAGWSYSEMGIGYMDIGKAEVAAGYFQRARSAGEAEGERRLEAAGLGNLGLAYARLGDARRAIGYYEQALAIRREIGDRQGEGNWLGNLGEAYRNLGDARRAIQYSEQALAIRREIGDRRGEGNALGSLGDC